MRDLAIWALIGILWHWSAPIGPPAPDYYKVRVRTAWAQPLLETSTPDTTVVIAEDRTPYRVDVQGCRVTAAGDTVCGAWSLVSRLYIPRQWLDLFYEVGFRAGRMPLTMVAAGVGALDAAWPDSGGTDGKD